MANKNQYAESNDYPGSYYQPLFNLMSDHYGLTLLQSELQDIISTVNKLEENDTVTEGKWDKLNREIDELLESETPESLQAWFESQKSKIAPSEPSTITVVEADKDICESCGKKFNWTLHGKNVGKLANEPVVCSTQCYNKIKVPVVDYEKEDAADWTELRDLWRKNTTLPEHKQGIMELEQFMLGYKFGFNAKCPDTRQIGNYGMYTRIPQGSEFLNHPSFVGNNFGVDTLPERARQMSSPSDTKLKEQIVELTELVLHLERAVYAKDWDEEMASRKKLPELLEKYKTKYTANSLIQQ